MNIEVRSLLRGAGDTRSFGRRLGALALPGDWVALTGDLGTGKTTLVAGIVDAVHPGMRARSPTYVRVEVYGEAPAIVHVVGTDGISALLVSVNPFMRKIALSPVLESGTTVHCCLRPLLLKMRDSYPPTP